jgi:hypothetical protein
LYVCMYVSMYAGMYLFMYIIPMYACMCIYMHHVSQN